MNIWQSRQGMRLAAILIGASILVSRFMGLIRDKIISYWFGASVESDLYFTAFVIPDFINYLLAGAYFSITLIPILQELFLRNEKDGWKFFSCALLWVAITIIALTCLGEIFAPSIVTLIAPGFTPDAINRLTTFVRIILPAQVFFLIGSCFSGLLYLKKNFLIPSISPLVYNAFIIGLGILFRDHGMIGFCWGVVMGAFVGNFLLPLVASYKGGGFRLYFTLKHPYMGRFFKTALPLMLGQSIVVLDEQFIRIFGSMVGEGSVSRLNYARRLMLVPVGVIGQAAAVASYPFLAELFAKQEYSQFIATLRTAIKRAIFVSLPVVGYLFGAAEPVVGTIFGQGRFEFNDVFITGTLFRIFLIGVPLWTYQQIIGRGFYATGNTISPVVIGTLATLISIPMFLYGQYTFGEVGIVFASIGGLLIYCAGLNYWWIKTFKNHVLTPIAHFLLEYTIICIIATIISILADRLLHHFWTNIPCWTGQWMVRCIVQGIVYTATWGMLTWKAMKPEIEECLPTSLRRFLRGI